jgi:hypothetical protein
MGVHYTKNGETNVKRFFLAIALMAVVLYLPAAAFATSASTGFYFDSLTGSASGEKLLDLGGLNSWEVWFTGSATISPTTSDATLTGNFGGNVWQYQYSTDNTNWTDIGSLVSTFSGSPNNVGNSKTDNGTPTVVTARWLRLRYDATLSSSAAASASGSGSISAQSVPEPGAMMALGSLLVPMGLTLIRKRA